QVLQAMYEVSEQVFSANPAEANETTAAVFKQGGPLALATLLSILIQFLVLPIVYELLRHRNIGVAISVTCALVFTQVIDAFFYEMVMADFEFQALWWNKLYHSFIIRAATMGWLSVISCIYLRMRYAEHTHRASSRGPMNLILSFLGSYSRAERLSANLQEWEGRYRMVFDNSHDLIFLVSEDGKILDINNAALRKCGYSLDEALQ
ncbi:MAG: PAS domain-containing protein, partial [Planctomycetes bacterium]|nr:PAS domain-containing protein [Planctomycetota bacterium]